MSQEKVFQVGGISSWWYFKLVVLNYAFLIGFLVMMGAGNSCLWTGGREYGSTAPL
ncbi:MAG: hypothetical protein QGG39_06820 [Candidatus Poribacteria bacterium]|nr:hypothetical protein [Candidatus Poribacteria bacterium]